MKKLQLAVKMTTLHWQKELRLNMITLMSVQPVTVRIS